jgi:hypothetical protein
MELKDNMATTYEKIQSTTLGTNSAINFTSIPGTYTDLRLVLNAFWTTGGPSDLMIRFNSDSTSNYSQTRLVGNGSAASSARTTSATQIEVIEVLPSTTIPGLTTIDLFSYAGSTFKTVLATGSPDENGAGKVSRVVGLYRSTSAITAIELKSSNNNLLGTGTTATLYGILKA